MTTLQSVNVGLGFGDYPGDATTPTTPRAAILPTSHTTSHPSDETGGQAATTPTAATFGGMNGQLPLPTSPLHQTFSSSQPTNDIEKEHTGHNKRDSQLSFQSEESQDIAMDDSDGEGEGGSDNEAVDPETGRVTKKKKGQRFFCTDFPPCRLSFTRSEHLARHIRKHTGERPFQCHCSRRFSRLDNLRQHAQTVHVNEDIPVDSLAATGTRFQRQIRTDRVSRPPHSRSRASTASSTGSHHRGHGRNLSTSSIGSTMSTISTLSRDDARRRPAPIIMANDPSRPRLTLDVLRRQTSTPPAQSTFYRESSDGLSTPTSTTYSTGGHSPSYGSSMGSPASNARNSGYWEPRGHNRRLSVPSAPMPFQSPQGNSYGSPYLSPLLSSHASNFPNINSSFGSPTSSMNVVPNREVAEAELRRRTWHPTPQSYTNFSRPGIPTSFARPATSGLIYTQTPGTHSTAYGQSTAAVRPQPQRLPGIETFDQAPRRPLTPPASHPPRVGSPMQIDPPSQAQAYPGGSTHPPPSSSERRGHASWDMSLHQNLTKLDLRGTSHNPEAQVWGSQPPPSRSEPIPEHMRQPIRAPVIHQEVEKRPLELESGQPSSNRSKRQGWYAGPPLNPVTSHPRTSPGGSTSSEGVPKTPTAPVPEPHPSIRHSNGFYDPPSSQPHPGPLHEVSGAEGPQSSAWSTNLNPEDGKYDQRNEKPLSNLDLLVAAATSQDKAAPQA